MMYRLLILFLYNQVKTNRNWSIIMNRSRLHRYTIYILLILCGVSVSSCRSKSNVSRNEKIIRELTIHKGEMKGDRNHRMIVDEAMTWVGTPYAYAKNDKGEGTDCSGMVMTVYEDVIGKKLPRNSAKQAEFCKSLDPDEVEIGDLVFFATGKDPDRISHVGIMIDEVNFVHASTKKGVVVSRIDTPYYIRTFKMFGRVP